MTAYSPVAEAFCDCPWCGRAVALQLAAEGSDREYTGVLHALPTCEHFDRLDAFDFIHEMRKEIERQKAELPS